MMMNVRKHTRCLPVIIFILLPLFMGMGASGGSSPERIPVPAKKFTAVFIDQTDNETEARDVSIEGGTFLEGRKGEGTFAIAFENIKYMNFVMLEAKLQCMIYTRDGNTFQLVVNKNQKAFGRTPYGTFQILLGDLKRMTISGQGN